ncbi:hypothetical protein [Frigidibacter sp. MR17.24]|uniref:hypothetical protein n=1 Tax=Frigidibacter sp. MR17.24 TaxID=3127345 RepID=UPI003013135C
MKLEILISVLSLVVTPLAHLSGTAPAQAGLVLMVVPPWADPAAVADAGRARLIGPTRAPFGTLVSVDETAQFARLQQAGAWFLVDADAARWICGA